MWELEREPTLPALARLRCAIVGAGRLGRALATALRDAGLTVEGPLGRGARCQDADVVLLCVPDGEIANAAATLARPPSGPADDGARADGRGPLVGHCSGALGLDVLAPYEAFSLHPLMTVPTDGPSRLAGATAAVAGTTPRARGVAETIALHVGLTPVEVADEDRAAYHAAASIASNFLVTIEAAAERLAATSGVDRAALVPLVRATVENWASMGGERALTGPIVRGDEATVERQRAAIKERTPDLLPLFDALTDATRALAASADRAGGMAEDESATPRAEPPRAVTGPARPAAGARA
jgi:predicted short-subunit dehydrogenase-like oxidoreductase (DUF2520 family)